MYKRSHGRNWNELRPISFERSVFEFAAGSVLFEIGKTKILCAVTMQSGVPPFLKGSTTGWLTAEYALLPASTTSRTPREGATMKTNGRSVEISRLIGRTLRSIVDCSVFPDRTIVVDCDVLQADGGTRAASITAAGMAIKRAQYLWLQKGIITQPFLHDEIAAVSIGVMGDTLLLDPDFSEDSGLDADFNFVMTKTDKIIEVQGGCEKNPVTLDLFYQAASCAQEGIKVLFSKIETSSKSKKLSDPSDNQRQETPKQNVPLFSLKNRGKFAF